MESSEGENLEQKAEEAADEMKINLPGGNLPPVLRFIVLFMLAGGLSIIGSIFADIVNPTQTNLSFYLLRIVVGGLVLTTAYGIIRMQRWAIWIYGVALLIGLLVNPIVVVLPAAVFIYLFVYRERFVPSLFDYKFEELVVKIRSVIHKNPS